MRTLILALTVMLFTAPAWAAVDITLEWVDANNIAIGYDSTGEAELVRAFALDVTAVDGNIIGISTYAVGDDNGGYGIFPGSFAAAGVQVDPGTGEVVDWGIAGYTPVAPASHPDALGAIPGPGITIELGSLYDTAAPEKTGVLCVLEVDENVTEICVEGNAIRGNIVMEDTAEMIPTQVCNADRPGDGGCFPTDDPAYDDWVAYGKPECWCYARQCHGDADGLAQGSGFAGYQYVSTNDLAVLISGWQVKEPTKGPGILSIPGAICADFAHDRQGSGFAGYTRVDTNDLAKLIEYWQVKEPTKGPGTPPDCLPEANQIDPDPDNP